MVQFLDPETAEILQFLDPEIVKMDKKILDPEIVEMVRFLDPEIVEKVDKSFIKMLEFFTKRLTPYHTWKKLQAALANIALKILLF